MSRSPLRPVRALSLAIPLLLGLLLTGCGQKGDLYLPSDATPPAQQ